MSQISEFTGPPSKRMPSRLRSLFSGVYARVTYGTGLWRLVYAVIRLIRPKPLLAVFTFHRIDDVKSLERHLVTYDKGTPQDIFEKQITGIKRFYQLLTLEQFLEVVVGKRPLQRHAALLTFDDADSEFPNKALPILQKQSSPSVVFVPTDFVDSTKRFWHLRVSNAFLNLDDEKWLLVKELSRTFPEDRKDWLEGIDYKDTRDLILACWRFNIALDRMSENEIESYIERLESITGREYNLGIMTMSWSAIRDAAKRGVCFESHSASHRKLARLDSDSIQIELTASKAMLEKQLSRRVSAICYPAGSYNEEVGRLAGEAGYKIGFVTRFGFIDVSLKGLDLLALPRFDMRGTNPSEIERFLGELPLRRFRKGWPLKS